MTPKQIFDTAIDYAQPFKDRIEELEKEAEKANGTGKEWQKTIHKLQKENEVLKDRIKELEGRVITDNSKVNTNLLKENEALKQQVKEECTCNDSLSYCAMHPKH